MASVSYLHCSSRLLITISTFLISIALSIEGEEVGMKIVEGPTIQRYGFQHEQNPTLRTHPVLLNGPPHLLQMNGTCLQETYKGYEYKVCPFHNVTQKEEGARWGRYHGVLGVFRDWIVVNDTFLGMYYAMGESCGNINREVQVYFECHSWTKLSNVSEVEKCRYRITLYTPLACFKAAMKENVSREWQKLEYQYYNEILTFKGLSVYKQRILQDVGILYKEVIDGPKQPSVKDEKGSSVDNPSTGTTTVEECNKVKKELQGMKDLFSKLRRTIQNEENVTIDAIEHILRINSTNTNPTSTNSTNTNSTSTNTQV